MQEKPEIMIAQPSISITQTQPIDISIIDLLRKKRRALIVGINDYAPTGPGGPDLNGCVNDAKDHAHTLNALKLVPATPLHMKILTDKRATRANIINGLKWLIQGAKQGDRLIFTYSGHGSQVPDINGDGELDGKDETICPHDYATAGMIKDDDLRDLFNNVPAGVNLDVVLDSCHAGTGTKELTENPGPTVRYIEPPIDTGYFLEANPMIPTRGIMRHTEKEIDVTTMNHVLWAACRDYQTASEANIGGKIRGVFTYCFCRVLRRAGVTIQRGSLDGLVASDVASLGFSQIPRLEATWKSVLEPVFT
jgi:hypothetical protein